MATVEDFAATFPSERVLQQALARLLAKIPGHTGVQILQGPNELGKDLIFYTPGPFGTKDLNACVVKNTKITGDAKATTGARTVFNQAQQALDTPLIDENGREQRVRRVFIITPHPIPPTTAASILGALRIQEDRVQFIGGATLLALFKDHWPEYLAEEYKLIQTYADTLAQTAATTKELEGLSFQYQLGQVETNIKRVYVQPRFHRAVRTYSLHPLLDTLPTQIEYRPYSQAAVSQMITTLKRTIEFVTVLHKWRMCPGNAATQARQACEELTKAIESDWSKTLAAVAVVAKKSSTVHKPLSAGFRDPRKLNELCQVAAWSLNEAFKPLQHEIAFAAQHIHSTTTTGGVELSADDERRYALLDDIARTVGSSCIREVDECSDTFDSRLIDVYRGPLLLVAPAGFGKTSFCRWHALHDLEHLMQGHATTLPVYVPLHQLGHLDNKDFKQAFLMHAGVSALLPKNADIRYDRIRVYLDGLDEVANQATQDRIAELAQQASKADPSLQVIITARDYVFGPFMAWLPRIRLSGFNPDQARELVSNWLDQNVATIDTFFSQLRIASVLSDMMEIPLLATLIVLVFKQTAKLPENKTRLYEMFVDLHNGGWDLAKGIQRPSRFSAAEKMFMLKRIAAKMHFAARREMIEEQCAEIARDTFKKVDWTALKSELVRDGLLVQLGGALAFSHHSFQEFLTAKQFLGDPREAQLRRCCEEFLKGSDWWYEVLCFYMDLVGKPQELHQWLNERFRAVSSAQGLERIELLNDHLRKSFPYAKF